MTQSHLLELLSKYTNEIRAAHLKLIEEGSITLQDDIALVERTHCDKLLKELRLKPYATKIVLALDVYQDDDLAHIIATQPKELFQNLEFVKKLHARCMVHQQENQQEKLHFQKDLPIKLVQWKSLDVLEWVYANVMQEWCDWNAVFTAAIKTGDVEMIKYACSLCPS